MLASISKTKSGKFAVRYRDGSGRQRWRTVGTSRRDAEKVRADIERRMALGHLYEAKPETLGLFLHGWLERYKLRVRPSTHARRCQALKALGVLSGSESTGAGPVEGSRVVKSDSRSRPRVQTGLSHESLRSLSVAEVEDAVAELAARAPRQAQMALAALKDALRDARKRGQRASGGSASTSTSWRSTRRAIRSEQRASSPGSRWSSLLRGCPNRSSGSSRWLR